MFYDDKIAAQILETNDVAKIKALERLVSGYDDHHWNGVRQVVVYEGLRAKWKGQNLLGYALMMARDKIEI